MPKTKDKKKVKVLEMVQEIDEAIKKNQDLTPIVEKYGKKKGK